MRDLSILTHDKKNVSILTFVTKWRRYFFFGFSQRNNFVL